MFLIFGFGRRRVKDLGPVVACTCSRCHNEVSLSLVHVTAWFTLFFIPLVPYSRKQFLTCPICAWSLPVTNASGPALDEMAGITRTWRAGEMADADYAKRIEAFWAHLEPTVAA